jgi:hypothetical protein
MDPRLGGFIRRLDMAAARLPPIWQCTTCRRPCLSPAELTLGVTLPTVPVSCSCGDATIPAFEPDRCRLCQKRCLLIDPQTSRRFVPGDPVECRKCGAPTLPEIDRSWPTSLPDGAADNGEPVAIKITDLAW